jgi:hypothetical protein
MRKRRCQVNQQDLCHRRATHVRRSVVTPRSKQFWRNFYQLTACEQAEMILYAALDPAIARQASKGDFVRCLDHFDLLQSPIN